ncbi:ATPase family AAA domain-containing protein 5 isoform X2 [Nematostella vectensis]|uniref:ATPase family AAA domain-containing protein 5 isoform X2 n=1 Tax=Nematostella vectensis TaxID=45351 RepID=UPI002076ED4C|nr:ATPase family AAA domain-containing protein 5 isoform X2 [Nematostella vectensis]
MSAKMLGAASMAKEIDEAKVSPDRPSNQSKSIKSFFQSRSPESDSSPIRESPSQESKDSKDAPSERDTAQDDAVLEEKLDGMTRLQGSGNKSEEKSIKKTKQKWSLTWRVANKSKQNTTTTPDSDFEEDSLPTLELEDNDEKNFNKDNKNTKAKKKGKVGKIKNADESITKDDNTSRNYKAAQDGRSKNNVFTVLMSKPTSRQESQRSQAEVAHQLQTDENVDKKDIKKVEVSIIESPSTAKCVDSADLEDDTGVSNTTEKSSMKGPNAFKLMMQKSRSPTSDKEVTKNVTAKPAEKKFKLNICYSKKRTNFEIEDDDIFTGEIIGGNKKYKSADANSSINSKGRRGTSRKADNTEKCSDEGVDDNGGSRGYNTTNPNESSKKTKIKNKNVKKQNESLDAKEPVNISDSSNLSSPNSCQIVEKKEKSVKRRRKREGDQDSTIKSSGSEDFDPPPRRPGLRSRTKLTQSVEEVDTESERDEKEKKKRSKKKEKEGTSLKNPLTDQEARSQNNTQTIVPQKLAPIFLQRPKPQKNVTPASTSKDQTEATSTDKLKQKSAEVIRPEIPAVNQEELAAANKVFNSLFSGSRGVKGISSTVQITADMPAPWPTVSHVLQAEESSWKLEEPVWGRFKLGDYKVNVMPEMSSLALGDVTHSSNRYLRREKQEQVPQYEPLSSAMVKKVLSDISAHYPGIPVKKLYKQYKAKEDEARSFAKVKAGYPTEKEDSIDGMVDEKTKAKISKNKSVKTKGGSKRKLSVESGEEGSCKKQLKKEQFDEEVLDKGKIKEDKKPDKRFSRKGQKRERSVDYQSECQRRSTRTRTPSSKIEPEGKVEKKTETSKTKKRKTMDDSTDDIRKTDKTDGETKTPKTLPSEDSRLSQEGQRAASVQELPWSERFKPTCSSEVMGNASTTTRLRTWLEQWKIKREKTLRKELELQKRLLAKQNKSKAASSSMWKEDSDSDFQQSDSDSEGSCVEDSGLCNAMLVVGPRGAGKTASIYACAGELGYKVFEVNCTSKRSSKHIISQLEEATQSHLVMTNPSTTTPHSSAFGGLFKNISEKIEPPVKNPVSAFFKSSEKDKPKEKLSKKRGRKSEKGQKSERKEKKEENDQRMDGSDGSSSKKISIKAASLILFEEVDVIFEEDRSFWAAVNSFMRNTKCPIIMTSNDVHVGCDGRYEQLLFKLPSINLLSAHLQLTALINHVVIQPSDIKALVSLYGSDIRQCFLMLQFWLLSGGGKSMEYAQSSLDEAAKNVKQTGFLSVQTEPSSQGVSSLPTGSMSIMEDAGEESMFLSLDDWQSLRETRRRGKAGADIINSTQLYQHKQHELYHGKMISQPLGQDVECDTDASQGVVSDMLEDTRTESMLAEAMTTESQSLQVTPGTAVDGPLPRVHFGLTESALGILNCAKDAGKCWNEMFQEEDTRERVFRSEKLTNLTTFTQSSGFSIVTSNLASFLPRLFAPKHSISKYEKQVTIHDKPVFEKTAVGSLFMDKNIFDDDVSSEGAQAGVTNMDMETKATNGKEEEQSRGKHPRTQLTGKAKILNDKALDVFTNLVEDRSFMDSYIPSSHPKPAVFGWWHAHIKPGISDDVITIRDRRDLLMKSRLTAIRGALEVASFRNSQSTYRDFVELTGEGSGEDLHSPPEEDWVGVLPLGEMSDVIGLEELTDPHQRRVSSQSKLYRSVSSALPPNIYCCHRAVCTEYLPTLRAICHTERLREAANTKRRFLHYLNSNSFPFSRTTLQSIADSYLG